MTLHIETNKSDWTQKGGEQNNMRRREKGRRQIQDTVLNVECFHWGVTFVSDTLTTMLHFHCVLFFHCKAIRKQVSVRFFLLFPFARKGNIEVAHPLTPLSLCAVCSVLL